MIRLKELQLPAAVRAFTVPDLNGDYDIIVNADLSDEAKLKAFKHELSHILNNDFEKTDADSIEETRH